MVQGLQIPYCGKENKKLSVKKMFGEKNEKLKRYNGGFPAEFLVFGPYRKVWEWFRSISSNFHRNRTAGELKHPKNVISRYVLFSFTQYQTQHVSNILTTKTKRLLEFQCYNL